MALSPVTAGSLVGERLGKYHLLALIAIGGTAEIYLARIGGEAGFEKYVVVKCLLDHLADDTDFVRMFLDEARLCAQLDHSNIVQTLELGQHEGRYYMVMEHLAGMSLAQLARKTHERQPEGVLPTRIVLGLAAQACAGLHYAHQRTGTDGGQLNVVHRDVSPQNLVVTFEGMLKIVDFGIAKAALRQTHTRTGTIKGKFAYMSPEQCLAEPIDRRTDVFALGTVVHELLTARRLFKRASTYETYQAILKGNPPPPSRYNETLDAELDKVVLRALAYAKEDRYETTEAFGEAMLGWLHSRGHSVSATDVARFVEKVCAQEIEEHGAHMRELISGHQGTNHGETLRWDSANEEDAAESKSLGASPLSSDSALRLDLPSDYEDDPEDSDALASALDSALAGIPGRVSQHNRNEEDFAGDTQIELDPLERVAALEAEAAEKAREPAKPAKAAAEALLFGGAAAAAADDRGSRQTSDQSPAAIAAAKLAAIAAAKGQNPGPRARVDSPSPARPGNNASSSERAHFPPASLRPRTGGHAPANDRNAQPGGRRNANEPTAPEREIGGAAHDQLTMPASDLPQLSEARGQGSSPIAVYETPAPGLIGQHMWADDSAEVLRQGRGAQAGSQAPHLKPTLAPGQVSAPQPGAPINQVPPSGPSHSGPSHAGPSHAGPSHAGPSHSGPSHAGPMPQPPGSQPSDGPAGLPPHARATLLRPPPQGLARPPVPQPQPRSDAIPLWLLAVAFLVSAGLGLGLTVLIGSLIA